MKLPLKRHDAVECSPLFPNRVTTPRPYLTRAVLLTVLLNRNVCSPGFPRSIEKLLNCEIGFQDLEKVSNLAKMFPRH